MKKQLLAGAFVLASFLTAQAQDSCANAATISLGTTTVGTINGEYLVGGDGNNGCWGVPTQGEDATAAEWYAYEAAADGFLRVNTDLAANVDGDTRISIYTGACDALVCYYGADDTPANYLTNITFPVTAGETYYIAFDNKWSDAGFDVELSTVGATNIPYAYGFESEDTWLTGGGFNISSNAEVGQVVSYEGEGFAFTNTSPDAAANARLLSRNVNLTAGQVVNVSFYAVYLGNEGDVANVDFTVGDLTAQEVVTSFEIAANQSTEAIEYVEYTTTYTAEETGVYNFGFHHNSPAIGTAAFSVLLDSIVFDGTAGTNDNALANLSVFPNPTSNVVNVTVDALVSNVAIVDLNGRTVKSVKFDGASNVSVNVSDLASGVYMMTVSSDKGTSTKKIVKN